MAQPSLLDALRQYLRDAAPGGALNPEVTGQGILDAGAMATAPVPGVGDVVGLLADANRMRDPNERTPMNMALMALGVLPFVPSGLRQAKKAIGKADDAKRAKTSFEVAHEVAQRNAALPVSQGGLGLPPNNTAMDRAKALGFDTDVYHGAKNGNQTAFMPSAGGELGPGVYVTRDGDLASEFAHDAYGAPFPEGAGVYPIKTKSLKEMPRDEWVRRRAEKFAELQKKNGGEWSGEFYNQGHARMQQDAEAAGFAGYYTPGAGGVNQGVVVDPKNIRSRFAAFDPMKRDSSDILASLAPYLITGSLAGLLGLSSDNANAGQ